MPCGGCRRPRPPSPRPRLRLRLRLPLPPPPWPPSLPLGGAQPAHPHSPTTDPALCLKASTLIRRFGLAQPHLTGAAWTRVCQRVGIVSEPLRAGGCLMRCGAVSERLTHSSLSAENTVSASTPDGRRAATAAQQPIEHPPQIPVVQRSCGVRAWQSRSKASGSRPRRMSARAHTNCIWQCSMMRGVAGVQVLTGGSALSSPSSSVFRAAACSPPPLPAGITPTTKMSRRCSVESARRARVERSMQEALIYLRRRGSCGTLVEHLD